MDLNDFIAKQKQLSGDSKEPEPAPDLANAVSIALDIAKRKSAEVAASVQAIPPLGAPAVPN